MFTEDQIKITGLIVGLLSLPVTAIAKAVSLAKDVDTNRREAATALSAHEKLCEERMRHLTTGQAEILAQLAHIRTKLE